MALPMSANSNTSSSSGFITSNTWKNEWSDLTLLQERKNCLIYSGVRYDRRFLIKALHPEHRELTEYRQMQQREFRIGIALSHPKIATTYSLETVGELGECIVQEYIEGQTLTQWLTTKPSWAARERAAGQLEEVLEYLHAKQLTHRDLKGDNILITRNGNNVKLIDFGMSETDDSVYASIDTIHNEDARTKKIIETIYPRRYAITRQILRALPFVLSVCLLALAASLFYAAHNERHATEQEEQLLLERINTALEQHHAAIRQAAVAAEQMPMDSFCVLYDLPAEYAGVDLPSVSRISIAISPVIQSGWVDRDSLMNLYPDDEVRKAQIFDIWTQKTTLLMNELLQME